MVNLEITCPETELPENIGCAVDANDEILVVLYCTRFAPSAELHCTSACAELTRGGCRCSCHVPPSPLTASWNRQGSPAA